MNEAVLSVQARDVLVGQRWTCRAHFCLISKREMFKCTQFLSIVKEVISIVRLEL